MLRLVSSFLLVGLLGGLFWWGLRRDANSLPSQLTAGKKSAAEFSMPTLEPYRSTLGETLTLSKLVGGKPIVLNFWASWCPPCRREAPLFERYWRQYRDRILFVGANFQDNEAGALAFIREFDLTFPSGADPQGRVGVEYGVYGMPETFFITKAGKVLVRHVGEIREAQLEGYLRQLLVAP